MNGRRTAIGIVLGASAACLTACDPGIHVAWEKDFPGKVDTGCVEKALRSVAADVSPASYVDDGNGTRGFPAGTVVKQFNYSDPSSLGGYSLDIAYLPSGVTHYWHGWNKLGTEIPPEERRKVIPLLNHVNEIVSRTCNLTFHGSVPQIGPG